VSPTLPQPLAPPVKPLPESLPSITQAIPLPKQSVPSYDDAHTCENIDEWVNDVLTVEQNLEEQSILKEIIIEKEIEQDEFKAAEQEYARKKAKKEKKERNKINRQLRHPVFTTVNNRVLNTNLPLPVLPLPVSTNTSSTKPVPSLIDYNDEHDPVNFFMAYQAYGSDIDFEFDGYKSEDYFNDDSEDEYF